MAFPTVVAAGAVVLEWEGLQLGLLSVETWPEEVVVRAASVPQSEEAKTREERHRGERHAWMSKVGRAHREGQPLPEDGPEHPLGESHDRLRISLADDAGTLYRWRRSSRGGVTWDFAGEWFFTPAPPTDARELRLTFSIRGGPEGSTTVRLA